MADYCRSNMLEVIVDDDVHRLLPLEIIKDIGIADADADADELSRIAVLQELSSRLAAVLGDTKEGSQDHRRLCPASWATNSYYQHHHGPPQQPQVYRVVDSRGRIADGHVVNAQRAHTPSSFWKAGMAGTGIISLPRFAPAAARLRHVDVVPPAKQAASRGTGVFLPRAQAYPDAASGARTGGGAAMKPRRRRGKEQFRQQLRLHAQAVAGAPAELQARWRSDAHAASASHGCHDDELGLPQEWIY